MSKIEDAVAETGNRHFVTALARGLAVLRCFDRPRLELTVTEIARLTGLSQPTTWRLCSTLLECGYLVRGTSGASLRVGAPAVTLGYAAVQGLGPSELVRPYLQQLTDQTKGNSMLSVRSGTDIISVEQVHGEWITPNQPIGWRAPLIAIPSGLAVIVAMDEAARQDLMATLAATDPVWPRHRERIERAQAQYARDGYVILTGMVDGQYSAVATPLFVEGQSGQQWALSIGGATSRWSEAHLRQAGQALCKVATLLRPALAVT
ncbi:IclR family transcriptional regulator [Sphingobium sp. C100]|uniref:IclR family transcriptional regulator n=1 Tax=Sphingobium sp. C100 TaxID=1207055 RepID=UPI0003D63EF9|nr:helix-turn-helix domain-containing protein [Sphingobium sp. C100]ETI64231.1 IclR family transcriptional regulator [Sphingobium sp. C100]